MMRARLGKTKENKNVICLTMKILRESTTAATRRTRQLLISPNKTETLYFYHLSTNQPKHNDDSRDNMAPSIGLKRNSLSAEEDEGRRHQKRKFVACVTTELLPKLYAGLLTKYTVASDAMHIKSNALVISRAGSVGPLDALMNVRMRQGTARSRSVRSM